MRTALALLTLLAAISPLPVCARKLGPPRVDEARRTDFQRGVGLGLFASDPAYDYSELLDEIVAHGATDLLVVVAWYQPDVGSHDIAPRPGYSPSDETVRRTLEQARARNLRVSLLPIVRLVRRTPTEWRGRIAPRAGEGAWFKSYERYVLRMAKIAEATGVARFGVGSELLTLERYEGRWRELIARVRGAYRGRLYYSANWDHFDPIRFWDALDEVGVTAYFELTRDEKKRPTPAELQDAWRGPRFDLMRLRARVNKPLVITEIGYPSIVTAARYPWDETRKAPRDPALQEDLYRAFCDAFAGAGVLDGFFFWNWFGFGGASDSGYTPRNKPAAKAMKQCLERPSWDERKPRGGAKRAP